VRKARARAREPDSPRYGVKLQAQIVGQPKGGDMKLQSILVVAACSAAVAHAADIESGRAKASAVCAACHGANGVSVSDTIPNLAGQKARYLEAQLKALKDGARKNPLMNAIASQLSAAEMTNVAAFYASQPGATSAARSEFLPSLRKSAVTFPENYQATYTKYMTINFPDRNQVRYYYANPVAIEAAKAGKPLPDGSLLLVEVFQAKLGDDKKPVTGADGFFVPGALAFYTAMERQAGWGKDIPDMLRNDEWQYTVFTTAKQHRADVNMAECLACHKPLDKESYTFTWKQLMEVAKAK
jgi:cytochrome c553